MASQKDDFAEIFDVSESTLEKLSIYYDLLLKWQKAINIVSSNTIKDAWQRHFIDSAQISSFMPPDAKIYADLGCGGGFPGLVLAIMHPELEVHLVESDERKCQFMRTVIRETGIKNVVVHISRIEDIVDEFTPDFVTARALASLDRLLEYCQLWAANNPKLQLCFLKGAKADEEIEQARQNHQYEVEVEKSITDPDARILKIRNYSTAKN